MKDCFIGTAGWTIPKMHCQNFPDSGSQLVRYASRFNCAEINSTFKKTHRPGTYERWRESVPDTFRFSVKVPRTVSHDSALQDTDALASFIADISILKEKLGVLLVQLPPKQEFDHKIVERFLRALRKLYSGAVAFEPRHLSWGEPPAASLLSDYAAVIVRANPARFEISESRVPGESMAYYRLHGAPRVYYSEYSKEFLDNLRFEMRQKSGPVWCIFDNTASGNATGNALYLNQ